MPEAKSYRRLLVVSVSAFALMLWPYLVEGVAPWFLLFHGNALGKRVIMSDWQENQKLMLSIRDEATVKEGSLQGRPFIEMSYFWGPDWAHYVADGNSPDALGPEQGNQHGRFYPAFGDAKPLVTFDSATLPLNRRITQDGLNLLAKYGIPTRIESAAAAGRK
jgi:hypothetical protein